MSKIVVNTIVLLVVLIIIGLLLYAVGGDPQSPNLMDGGNPANTFWHWLTSPDGAGLATK